MIPKAARNKMMTPERTKELVGRKPEAVSREDAASRRRPPASDPQARE